MLASIALDCGGMDPVGDQNRFGFFDDRLGIQEALEGGAGRRALGVIGDDAEEVVDLVCDDETGDAGVESLRFVRVFTPSYLGGDSSFAEQTEKVYSTPGLLLNTLATKLMTAKDLQVALGIGSRVFTIDVPYPVEKIELLNIDPNARFCYVHFISKSGKRSYGPHDLKFDEKDGKLFVSPSEGNFEQDDYIVLLGLKNPDSSGGMLNLAGRERVLALGVGNGRIAGPMFAAFPGLKVTMVDLNSQLLNQADDFCTKMIPLQSDADRQKYDVPEHVRADIFDKSYVEKLLNKAIQYDVIDLGLMRTMFHSMSGDILKDFLTNLKKLLTPKGKILFDASLVDSDPKMLNWQYQLLVERHKQVMRNSGYHEHMLQKLNQFAAEHGYSEQAEVNGLFYDIPGEGQAGQTRCAFSMKDLRLILDNAGFDKKNITHETVEVSMTQEQIDEFLGANSMGTTEDKARIAVLMNRFVLGGYKDIDDEYFARYLRLFERARTEEVLFNQVNAFMKAEFSVHDDTIAGWREDPVYRTTYFVVANS